MNKARMPLGRRAARGRFLFWKPVLIVLLAEAAAIIAYYTLEWTSLRQLHVLWLHTSLGALGSQVYTAGSLLTVEDHHFQIDPDCTYVDLILRSLPLLWRVPRRLVVNLAVLAGFAGAVLLVNLGRVLFGVYAFTHGASPFWAHDLVDDVLWYPTMAVVAWLSLRSLRTTWPEAAKAVVPAQAVSGSPTQQEAST